MPTPPTLITIAPELVLSIAEYLPLHALQALVRCNRLLYHLLLGFLYKRAILAGPVTARKCWDGGCLLEYDNGWKGRPWLGNARQVTLCLAAGMDVHMKIHWCDKYTTRLHLAARNRWNRDWPGRESKDKSAQEEEEVMRILLAHGADVNTATKWRGESPLHAATECGNFNMAALLLDSGADVNKATKTGRTPLDFAMNYSYWPLVELLLAHGADNGEGESPLQDAVKSADYMTVGLLLKHGANPNSWVGKSPLQDAVKDAIKDAGMYTGSNRVMALLLEHGANPNSWVERSPLQEALLELQTPPGLPAARRIVVYEIVRLLVKAGASVEMLGERERNLVMALRERQTKPTPTPAPTDAISLPQMSSTPSVTTGRAQPPQTTSEPPRDEMGEGWTKVERKKGKGKREKKVENRAAGGVPTWADIARGGGAREVFIGRGAGYTKPAGKKQQGQQRPASSPLAG